MPLVVALDYETALLDGTPSVEYYRDDFRVVSASFSWYDRQGVLQNLFEQDEPMIYKRLKALQLHQALVVVHNFQFEYGVTKYRFPDINLNWHADTMRLVQVADNGGSDYEEDTFLPQDDEIEVKKSTGLSLQASISRWLDPQYHNHKEPFYQAIRDQGIKKGKEGQNLHLLTPEQLRDYNVADSDNTLRLYNILVQHFKRCVYDWRVDHALYLSSARFIAGAKGRGIRVNREKLDHNIRVLAYELGQVSHDFLVRFKSEIDRIEQDNLVALCSSKKTEKGLISAWGRCIEQGLHLFNLTSVKQKAALFVDILGMEPQFFTEKGGPAFGKAFLKQWGEGGLMLQKRGTLLIALRQMESLLKLSEYDSKYHVDLRACGTKTGRKAGGRI